MATLQGQRNSISDRIYQSIMSVTPNRCPHTHRPVSANTQLSFPSSPRHSARSQVSQTSKQGAYSDYDIIKNRSWSASRVKSSHLGKAGSKRVNAPAQQPGGLSALIDSRPLLSPAPAPGTASTPGDSKGKQLGTRDLWNLKPGSQVDRLQQEWAAVEQCRAMKRASEMVQHRLDPMYRISGSNIPLLARYHVNDHELQRLREMTETSRVLQLDLKRIKYPQGCHSPRREKTHLSKSHVKLDPRSSQPEESREGDKGRGQIDVLTSPLSQPLPAVGDPHPTSPVSTPEDTPRFPGGEGQEESTEQGEASYTENSHHVS